MEEWTSVYLYENNQKSLQPYKYYTFILLAFLAWISETSYADHTINVRRRSKFQSRIQIDSFKYSIAAYTVHSVAALAVVNRHTATLYFHKLRELIATQLDAENPKLLAGEIEVDESYFGGVRKS